MIGALVSAASALVDWASPASAPAWALFHEGNFAALGLRRASGVFGYPTIGAMYWEAALPLLLVTPFRMERSRAVLAPAACLAAVVASAVLSLAILASATRTALAGAAVGGGPALHPRPALGARCRAWPPARSRSWSRSRPSSSGSGAPARPRPAPPLVARRPVVRRASTSCPGSPPAVEHRRGARRPGHPAQHGHHRVATGRAHAHASLVPLVSAAGGRRSAPCRSSSTASAPPCPTMCAPGEVVRVVAAVRAPTHAGTYRLSLDLVQEDVAWFSERGNRCRGEQLSRRAGRRRRAPREIPLPGRRRAAHLRVPSLWSAGDDPLAPAPAARRRSGQFPAPLRGRAPSAAAGRGVHGHPHPREQPLLRDAGRSRAGGARGARGARGRAPAVSAPALGLGLRGGPRVRGGGRRLLRARPARLLLRVHAAVRSVLGDSWTDGGVRAGRPPRSRAPPGSTR